MKSTASPFGHLQNFWYRIEFQHRGSPHMHCLLWIAYVPQYGVSDTTEVTQYIHKIISCHRTWGQDLDGLVELQVHKHTRTCKKQFRNSTVCLFGFPKYLMCSCVQRRYLNHSLVTAVNLKFTTQTLNHIKTFLASIKPAQESRTINYGRFLGST